MAENIKTMDSIADDEVDEVDEDSVAPKPDVNEFSTKTSLGDFVLRVEDKPLHVNKTVLCLFSPVFNVMLNGEWKEKCTGEVKLTGKKYEDVSEFLRCLLPHITKPITMSNVFVVLPLAHEYQVKILKNACGSCLLLYLSGKEVLQLLYEALEIACLYELSEVKEKCVEIISERSPSEFDEAERKFTFSDDVGNKIRKRLLENLALKFKDVFGHVQTSRALYRFLGAAAKQKVLLNKYLNGKVVGDYLELDVNARDTSIGYMCVDGIEFTINAFKQQCSNNWTVSFSHESDCISTEYLCGVVVHNTMVQKDDIIYAERKYLNGNHHSLQLPGLITELFNDTHRGFCRDGTIQLQIYLFK